MNRDSKFYNPEWPEYYCESCGEMFQLKFGLGKYCSNCLESTHKKVAEKLKNFHQESKAKNIRFKKYYIKRK